MYLTDHNPLGTIYYKGAPVGHERNITDIDILLADLTGLLEDQIDSGFYGHSKGDPFLLALLLSELDRVLVKGV